MQEKSHIDLEKLDKVPLGKPFEYKDIVGENLSIDQHTEDGKRFKVEVLDGVYDNIKIEKDSGSHLVYKKI